MIRTFHAGTDPFEIRKASDLIFAKSMGWVMRGKQKVIQAARSDKILIENIKSEWNYIQELGASSFVEIAQIVNSLREEAMLKAPAKWEQMILMATQYLEDLKKACSAGNPEKAIDAFQSNLQYHRQYYVSLKKFFASKQ